MDKQPPLFNYGQWHYELIEAMGCYRQLKRFCSDESAVRTHLHNDGRPKRVTESGEFIGIRDDELERFVIPISESIETAVRAYQWQLIVLITSITEAAIAEAVEVLFWFKPQVMKALETQENGLRLGTTLDELMTATDLSSLRVALVERAMAVATQGKSKAILRRIEKLFGAQFPETTFNEYLALVEQRNAIVHENRKPPLSDDDLYCLFDVGMALIEELGRFVAKHDLPVHDPMKIFSKEDDGLITADDDDLVTNNRYIASDIIIM